MTCKCGAFHGPICPNAGEGELRPDGSVAYHQPALEGIQAEVQHSIHSGKPVTAAPGMIGAGVVILPTGQPRVILQIRHPDGTSVAGILTASGLATIQEILTESGIKAQAISDAATVAAGKPN